MADVGSGTGKLTELFLAFGNRAYGVEPNGDMRREAEPRLHVFPNSQRFDWDGLLGRVRSTSYCPRETDAAYPTLVRALRGLFDRWQDNGTIEFVYKTVMHAAGLAD